MAHFRYKKPYMRIANGFRKTCWTSYLSNYIAIQILEYEVHTVS